MPAPGEQHRATNLGMNPFEEIKPHISEYTAEEIAILQGRLSKQLGPEYLSTRPGPGGSKVHYIAAHSCINLANEVFGFNGWSSQIQNVAVDFVEEHEHTRKIEMGLSVIVRVTLRDGTFHEDMGYGHIANCQSKAAAFEKCKKEATTDALKRALRNFGNVLGNCIYDQDYLKRVTKVKVASSRWDPENLQRHSDYVPQTVGAKAIKSRMEGVEQISRVAESVDIKKEPVANMRKSRLSPDDSDCMISTVKSGEDEFGVDDFDEVDFSVAHGEHPDEVVLEASSIEKEIAQGESTLKSNTNTTIRRAEDQGSSISRPTTARMQSLPPPSLNGPQTPIRNATPMIQVDKNLTSGQNTIGNQQKPQLPPPQGRPHPPPQVPHTAMSAQGNSLQSRPDTPTVPRFNAQPQHFQNQPPPNEGINNGISPAKVPETPGPPRGHIPPVGFFTAKAAGLVQAPDGALPANVPAFNPHLESPSIRKTAGIDHTKTKPVGREVIGAPPKPTFASRPAQNSANFVNPQIDQTRKIGMPLNRGASPMQNRNSYKPPTNVPKRPADGNLNSATMQGRPALGDVTSGSVNVPPSGGDHNNIGGDFKRQKVGNGPGPQGFGNAQNQQNLNVAPG